MYDELMSFKKNFLFLFIFFFLLVTKPVEAAIPAFPGAEGFGSETPGGRGGQVSQDQEFVFLELEEQ
jgi:hypothetical protein